MPISTFKQRELFQNFMKQRINEVDEFMEKLSKQQLISYALNCAISGNDAIRDTPITIANRKTLRTKKKLFIYIHNLNKIKAEEYMRKYRECKTEEMELIIEHLNGEGGSDALMRNNGKEFTSATTEKNGTEFIRKYAEEAQLLQTNINSWFDFIKRGDFWL